MERIAPDRRKEETQKARDETMKKPKAKARKRDIFKKRMLTTKSDRSSHLSLSLVLGWASNCLLIPCPPPPLLLSTLSFFPRPLSQKRPLKKKHSVSPPPTPNTQQTQK
jgi:hypothetical protein